MLSLLRAGRIKQYAQSLDRYIVRFQQAHEDFRVQLEESFSHWRALERPLGHRIHRNQSPKLHVFLVMTLTVLCLTPTIPAMAADVTLFSNGPGSPNDPFAWELGPGVPATNSFYIGAPATITGVSVGLWVDAGHIPLTVELGLGTAPFGSDLGFVLGLLPSLVSLGHNSSGLCVGGCDVYQATFRFPGIAVDGTSVNDPYWLSMQSGYCGPGCTFFGWDQNSGVGCTGWNHTFQGCPSQAFYNGFNPIPSEDPEIIGFLNNPIPEPGSIMLFGSAIVGLAAGLRRKLKLQYRIEVDEMSCPGYQRPSV
jgi:hypothetical protein